MFFNTQSKNWLLNVLIIIVILFTLLFSQKIVSAQLLGYPFINQAYLPVNLGLYNNTYNLNPYYGISPYLSLYNPLVQNISLLNRTSTAAQASIAGALVPFANPLTTAYNPFSSILANSLTPFATPVNYLYNAAVARYIAATTVPANVSGSWAGIWVSTFLAGGVTTGDLSITLAQLDIDVTGTVVFLLNKVLKFGAEVVGTVTGNSLILTSTVIPSAGGTKSFDVTLAATVIGNEMEGTYVVVNNVTGNTAEEGTFTATRL